MKSVDLKFPYGWNERRILIKDRVWYIPIRMDIPSDFSFMGWHGPEYFGNENPVCVEYCSGNGAWITDKAKAFPDINWVAVEKKFARVSKIWSRMKNMGLNNLIIICGEAHNATKQFFSDDSFHDVFINFPDPWPKNRHAKHRLIQEEFAKELWRILKKGRSLTFVTDDPPYSNWLIEVMHEHRGFSSVYPEPYYTSDHSDYGVSYFEQLWRSKGRMIRYHKYHKVMV